MSSQVALAIGIANGRVHTDQDHAVLRSVELARRAERQARRVRRGGVLRLR